MSKIFKALSIIIGVSTFCLISPILPVSIAQAETPRDFDPDISGKDEEPPSTQPEEPVATTTFCDEKSLTTVVKNDKGRAVLITWKTNEFGGSYTRLERCRIVSARFQNALQSNGGALSGLILTNGPVNDRVVICALRPGEEECSSENMLFTLKRENEPRAGAILGRLLNISVTGSGSSIEENSGQQVKVDMGTWASRNLRRTGNTNTNDRTNPSAPSTRPVRRGVF
jgi:hypothetical protein